jgi:carbon monoxide dehydrogenase subunit G
LKVELEKKFPMTAAPEVAWRLLRDVEAVAACMPGAKITQRIDDTHYKGTVTVRVGPATLSFRGDIEVREQDGFARRLRLFGSGSDTTGSSAGSMDLTARIDEADGEGSLLVGQSVVSLSGKAAAFGGRMVNSVADQILGQFARNFAARLAMLAPPLGPAEAAPESVGPSATSSTTVAVGAPSAAESVATSLASTVAQAAAPTTAPAPAAPVAPPSPPPPPVATEIDGLALLWAICKDWLRGLFGRKGA